MQPTNFFFSTPDISSTQWDFYFYTGFSIHFRVKIIARASYSRHYTYWNEIRYAFSIIFEIVYSQRYLYQNTIPALPRRGILAISCFLCYVQSIHEIQSAGIYHLHFILRPLCSRKMKLRACTLGDKNSFICIQRTYNNFNDSLL